MSHTPPTDLTCPAVATSRGGPALSRIVAGMWRMNEWKLTPQQRLGFIEQCLAMGVSSFDHADIYGGYGVEALFGEALALQPSLRARMQLVSKCGIKLVTPARPAHTIQHYDTSAGHIIASAEHSLRQLRTDHLDLLLIHRPDPLMDFDEIAGAFERLRADGKVKHFGVSNFSRHQFECLHRRIPLATNQVEFSPLHVAPMFDQTFDGLQDLGVAPMIWSALAGGRLFSRDDADGERVRAAIQQVADALGRPFGSVVYAWIMQLPSRPLPLTGSGRIEAVAEAVQATQFSLSREQWFAILRAARGHEVA
ncbi:oxidoreductase [Duganella sp. BJB488]|uniref:aldo/keto reductase n=1 Tax=unclassified Duganella TaxID=2636909 RepID=UPI000E346065|nr:MULTISPECIES: aldo/keto reductase [unclassified Duganella]RFP09149.1 oxidoreductase [Duganella sp. BJB489]RFP12579.1 oxidoreductase [Duganella sp. BJB488]RFP29146.1 oxidoreductase [Duganella sp. BJB480]